MKILVDANISYRIKKKLKSDFPSIEHVDSVGLAVPPSDTGTAETVAFRDHLGFSLNLD